MTPWRVAAIDGCLALAACAAPGGSGAGGQPASASAVIRSQPAELRLARLSRRLLVASAPRCSRHAWDYGFSVRRERPTAAQSEQLRIRWVVPDSSADRAGLRPGDRLLGANGTTWPSAAYDALGQRVFQAAPEVERLELRIARDSAAFLLTVAGEKACAIDMNLVQRRRVNAFASAAAVVVYSKIEQVLTDDDALSWVLAHEMAHVMLGHAEARKAHQLSRRQAERDADALSVRLLLAAGLDPAGGVRALATFDRYRGPLSRLFGITGPYLPTAQRQQYLRDQTALARAELAAPAAKEP